MSSGATEALLLRSTQARRSLYLTVSPNPVFAVLHTPAADQRSGIGVVLCPPFGWDELCTHRSLRAWADALAQAGHAALRIDLPGTGDSGGNPRDPARVNAWTGAIAAGGAWLGATQDCERIVAIGVGLGGMLAVRAVAQGEEIDDLVLWSVPARGRLLLRELRAFAQMAASTVGDTDSPEPPAVEDGGLEVAGFVVSAETMADLEALDLTKLEIPDGAARRVLLLGRDTLAPDRRLTEHFEQSGATVEVADGPGFAKMVTHPQFAERPNAVIAQSIAWLAGDLPVTPRDGAPAARTAASVASADHADLQIGEVQIRETPFEFDHDGSVLAGVYTTPISRPIADGAPCVILLNAGAVRRIGPNRMWVESARRWATWGVASLRLDMVGLGDSDGDEVRFYQTPQFYRDDLADQVRAALDEVAARGMSDRFLIGGLCSGAYWGFHVALSDERVQALMLVNLWSFYWTEELAAARDARRAKELLRSGAWRDVARIAVLEGRIGRMIRTKLRNVASGGKRASGHLAEMGVAIDDALAQLRERDVQVLLLLSRGEPLAEDFVADARIDRLAEWPNLQFGRIPLEDHIFRPVWAQQYVHRALDDALRRTLGASAPGAPDA
jgi:pimeloyl-ACP methyl ester carboxylesterase